MKANVFNEMRSSEPLTKIRVSPGEQGARVSAEARPRCFLLTRSDKDVSAARAWGDVVTLFPDGEPRPSIWSDDFVREAVLRLERNGFDSGCDYLIVSGSMVSIVTVACAVCKALDADEPGPTLLFFDVSRGGYVPRATPAV